MTASPACLTPGPGLVALPRPGSAPRNAGLGWQEQWSQAHCWLGQALEAPHADSQPVRKGLRQVPEPCVDPTPAPLQQRLAASIRHPDAATVADHRTPGVSQQRWQPHVHVESGVDGLHLWLGVPGPAPQAHALLAELLPRLRRDLQDSGRPLATVICNGQPLGCLLFHQEP